jgi:hypothetical protein
MESGRYSPGNVSTPYGLRFYMPQGPKEEQTGSGFWQGRRDSNPRPPVLETGALPLSYAPAGPARLLVLCVAVLLSRGSSYAPYLGSPRAQDKVP